MAKICAVIDVPHKTVKELRQLVHEDEKDIDPDPVTPENVDPIDILALVRTQPNIVGAPGYDIVYQSMED